MVVVLVAQRRLQLLVVTLDTKAQGRAAGSENTQITLKAARCGQRLVDAGP